MHLHADDDFPVAGRAADQLRLLLRRCIHDNSSLAETPLRCWKRLALFETACLVRNGLPCSKRLALFETAYPVRNGLPCSKRLGLRASQARRKSALMRWEGSQIRSEPGSGPAGRHRAKKTCIAHPAWTARDFHL